MFKQAFLFCVVFAGLLQHTLAEPLDSVDSEQQPAARSVQANKHKKNSDLANFALQKVLDQASQAFGVYENNQSKTANWMKAYHDDTLLVHMNLPGTHDADTWNYSQATQDSLRGIVDLVGGENIAPSFFRCQNLSMVAMLDAGIRVFDLRYAYDVTNTSLVFWHSYALVSEIATVDDVLFGFYKWLDDHPSEAIFLSFQYEGSTYPHNSDDAGEQLLLYNSLTSPAARKYFVQDVGTLTTLGKARGKATLLRRFDLNALPASFTSTLPGLHFSPANWTDNSPNITLIYNTTSGATAYIEDYYQPAYPSGATFNTTIGIKYNATTSHLSYAASSAHPDSLFWTFASSTDVFTGATPEVQAVGDGTADTGVGGVNQRLVPYLQGMQGKRLGIVMFDFFETPGDLMETFLGLLTPKEALALGKGK